MLEKIGQINSVVNAFVWGRGMLVIFLGVGMPFLHCKPGFLSV